ncbi:GNAT family N-acetyltransferase [Sphingobacterium alkalisoli]|uniref:GNAT family N-acetyltransferase n=1 Tax=Sphingobacterium alkalisoli TaxID=1874115 RepID=A0A4U0GUL9_9SPHI|nr:GNAT family N-acetyltransferase [Sphingobacterium alkalisoli]TJY62586.1 GNAT family N-acetyltransferase [Sphingobacterium alkalisoli]GGH27615.1 N-acetyltransferase [Sphingobacterium alkalisoli]
MDVIEIGLENQELVNKLFDAYRMFYGQESDVKTGATFITERLVRQETVIFVAMIGEEPVGFVQLYPKFSSARLQKDWILNDLYVLKRFRRQGVGEALINSSLTFAREAGASFMQLSTAFDNHTARRLYERLGFQPKGEVTGFFIYQMRVS